LAVNIACVGQSVVASKRPIASKKRLSANGSRRTRLVSYSVLV
jgi:hypothetical protein